MIKTGSQHSATLKDGRQVFINGELAGDVTEHAAFRRAIASVAALSGHPLTVRRRPRSSV